MSWETDLWVMLGDFTVKKPAKLGRGNIRLTENRFSGNEIRCAANNHNYICHICAKEFLDLKFH